MGYRTILVHCGPDEDDLPAVRTAALLGARFDATLLGVGAVAWAPLLDPALILARPETISGLREHHDAELRQAEARFRAGCAGYAGPIVWEALSEYPAAAMIRLAASADLIVVGPGPKDGDDRRSPFPADIILKAGGPVLLVAREQALCQPYKVLIGWKDTRETRRAVSDALPLLKIAERVVVAHMCDAGEAVAVEAELKDVVERLARHGVTAQWTTYPRLGAQADEDLMALAHGHGADTVVAGAYAHSRLREWALGGVTRNLLNNPERRVLFSR